MNGTKTQEFLNTLDMPSIGEIQNKSLIAEITTEELQQVMGKLKSGKSPGSDGFPSEWYRAYYKELMPLLRDTFNLVIKEGKTPPSWKEAIISVIPKEKKDREYCQNYRPISLLNTDYTIFSSILASRIQLFLPDLIDEDQTGFVKGRQTYDNIRRTLHIIDRANRNKLPIGLISLDAEKAFDRVNLEFLYLTLEKLVFNDKSVQCIKYQNPTARVRINGSLSERFLLERGTRQGCCLSPSLFAINIQPLAQLIRQHLLIPGVEINGMEHKICLFADDVMIYLAEPKKHLIKLMQVLEQFNEYAGFKLNVTKMRLNRVN